MRIVTAPINKEMMNAAGYHYAGHTELLAYLTASREYGMLFVGGGLRVILATIHVALKDVHKHITTGAILKTLRLAHRAMQSFGIEKPRIGVAALNPHAGEGQALRVRGVGRDPPCRDQGARRGHPRKRPRPGRHAFLQGA